MYVGGLDGNSFKRGREVFSNICFDYEYFDLETDVDVKMRLIN